ncbi:MAG: disulfide isomerase [Burkholderiaceae bacterium]|nr:MAG: disulfide isomerase [Burkholderiaceae bacterium]
MKSPIQFLAAATIGAAALAASLFGLNALAAQVSKTGAPSTALEAPVPDGAQKAADAQGGSMGALWQELEKTPFIREGADDAHAKATIYAFFDPNCIFCHLAWKLSQPYLKEGLQVRWIPIAFVMPDSAAKAAWLITSPDPATALNAGESGWKQGVADGGGAFLKGPVTDEVKARLKANETLFTKLGLDATPSFVYKDALGEVKTLPGLSNQHMFTTMTGLPFIPTTDPDLARVPE